MKKVVLLVGLIASGKSTFTKTFIEKGAAVISTDDFFREMVYQESNREALKEAFGVDVLFLSGNPDKYLLRSLLFSSDAEEKLACKAREKKLFETFKGMFFDVLHKRIAALKADPNVTMVVVENALALAKGQVQDINPDIIVSLTCRQEERLRRHRGRDKDISEESRLALFASQPTDREHFDLSMDAYAYMVSTEFPTGPAATQAEDLYIKLTLGAWSKAPQLERV